MEKSSCRLKGKEYLALKPDQVVCYEGSAFMTVLAGHVQVNGYAMCCDGNTRCTLQGPLGFPCHAIHSGKEPLALKTDASSEGACQEALVTGVAERSGLESKTDQQQLSQFLQKLAAAGHSIASVVRLEEKVDDVNRLLSGSCGLGQFYTPSCEGSDCAPAEESVEAETASSPQTNKTDKSDKSDGDEASSPDDGEAASSRAQADGTRQQLWPGFSLCSQASHPPFVLHQHWKNTISDILHADGTPTVMVSGGRNTGKSSFGRLLVNSMLNKHGQVVYIETDVGQTELTGPAMMSVHCLSQPLIGPPFSHQTPADMSIFFGDVSPADRPDFYVRCSCQLLQVYIDKYEGAGIPLVVNTHGWIRGLGITLVKEIYRIAKPSHLVAFGVDGPQALPKDWVEELIDTNLSSSSPVSSTVHHVQAHGTHAADVADKTRTIQSKTFRHLATVASLASTLQQSKLYTSDSSSPLTAHASALLQSVAPREIPWNSVAVHVMHTRVPRSQVMYALNGSIVALARAEDQSQFLDGSDICQGAPYFLSSDPVANCYGLGVIRGIDMSRKSFYICTALSDSQLQSVNLVLKGRLELAPAFLESPSRKRPSPYMSSDFPHTIMGAGAPKHRRNLKRR